METPAALDLDAMAAGLGAAYGIDVADITFLPLGADPEAAAWRIGTAGGAACFLKIRFGPFDPRALLVPRFLRDAGIVEVLAPLPTRDGALSAAIPGAAMILYPFVEGASGFEAALDARAWAVLGGALRRIHGAILPDALKRQVAVEAFAADWRNRVRAALASLPAAGGRDPVAAELASLLDARRADVDRIVLRAEALAAVLRGSPPPLVLCHTDIHAGNVMIGREGGLHIVDWDSPRLAPKERDLMFIGGGVGGTWNEAWQEDAFHRGYGAAPVDPVALSYYRYERIVEDIAVTCEEVFIGDGSGRAESLAQLAAQWQRRDVVEIADDTYDRLAGAAAG